MIDSEIYPVSFFSQAFDLIQKIQSDFHTLEADQVELFASQMKKHQALILSIHRQIRHIDVLPADPPANPSIPKTVQQTPITNPVPPKKEGIDRQQEDKQKKASFLSRLGISKEPAPKIIETPIRPPAAKPATEKPSAEKPVAEKPVVEKSVEEQPSARKPVAEKKPPRPVPKEKEKITRPPRPAAPEITETDKAAGPKVANASNGIPIEGSAPPSVNDAMEKRKLSDLRKAFSLNDRFRYLRELFGGSEEVMNKVITALNSKVSYKESILFLEEKLHWDFTDPTVKDFIKVLEIRFL
jgi:hypothetical protein